MNSTVTWYKEICYSNKTYPVNEIFWIFHFCFMLATCTTRLCEIDQTGFYDMLCLISIFANYSQKTKTTLGDPWMPLWYSVKDIDI